MNRPRPEGLKVLAVGDCILGHAISNLPDLGPIRDLLTQAHAAIGNFEGSLMDSHPIQAAGGSSGSSGWVLGEAAVARDLRSLGFDLFSRANNHVTDFGPEGLAATNRALGRASLLHAGSGRDRAEARAPAILDTPGGRIALVSATTTGAPSLRATMESRYLTAAPGANFVRSLQAVSVSAEQLRTLRDIRKQVAPGGDSGTQEDELELFGMRYRAGGSPGLSYTPDAVDLEELVQDVRSARRQADLVICSLHSHEPGNWSDEPSDMFRTIARAVIDAGAGAVLGHGPHRLRGIEIHRHCPILYSLGNFIFQVNALHPAVEALYADQLASEGDRLLEIWRSLLYDEKANFRSVMAEISFGARTEVRLIPIELRFGAAGVERGVPRLASAHLAAGILEDLRRLSQGFGTEIDVREGQGLVVARLPDPAQERRWESRQS